MSEEQSPAGNDDASATARRRTHHLEGGSFARSSVETGLTGIVDQVALAVRNPVLETVRQMQRSCIPSLFAQQQSIIAAFSAVAPKIETPSFVFQSFLAGFAPALRVSAVEILSQGLMARQFVPDLTKLVQTPFLVGQSGWRSLALFDLSSRVADVMRPFQDSVQFMVDGLFRQWSEVADLGAGLARAFTRAALFAAVRARDAALHGRFDEVDAFIEDWLDQEPTSWHRDAVVMVLLDGQWIPAGPDAGGCAVLGQIKRLTSWETRNHKWMAETQLRGYPVLMLDQPVPRPNGTQVSLAEIIADPATKDGLPISLGFTDDRLNRLLGHLQPDEQRVVLAYGDGRGETWEFAAVAAGLAPEYGERVRRKCKRVRVELARRATVLTNVAAQRGLPGKERR